MDMPKLNATDKRFAVGFLVLALVGGWIALPLLVQLTAWLVELAKNTIYFLIELAVLVFALLNATNLYYGAMSLVQAISRFIVRIDPVKTLNTAIDRMERKGEEISGALAASDASQKRLANRIRNRTSDGALDKADQEDALATVARTKNRPDTEIAQHVMAADRWRNMAATFQPMLEQLRKMQGMLLKAQELQQSSLADLKNKRDVLSVQLEAELDGQKAVGAFKRFFGRSPDLAMAGLSMEEIERQSSQAEAEIDQFLNAIGPQLQEADLKKSAATDAAMAKFNKFTETKSLTAGPVPPASLRVVKDAEVVSR
jgi:hypothetical protein